MQILLSKLPPSGWWQTGVPKYPDNPAMIKGAIPDLNLLENERNHLISTIKNTGHDILELDFPKILDTDKPNHDFIFIRDSFISNQNGTAVILRSGEISRRIENNIIEKFLNDIGMKTIQIPDRIGVRADGGEFYFCAKENILFSGLQRNSEVGAHSVAEALNVSQLLLLKGRSFHLDTFFTPCLDNQGKIAAFIVCDEILSNISKKHLYQFADQKNIPIFTINPKDAIGLGEQVGNLAINALPLPGLLIRPCHFSDRSIDIKLSEIGIRSIITPTTQFQLSGGSVHCITNEL